MNVGFPDVCNTPVGTATVPLPYPNIANASSASSFSSIVYVGMVNALNLNSSIPNTSGDESGSAGPTMGKASYSSGNPIVNVEKVPAINLACPTTGNNSNCSLAAVVVPAVSVVSYTDRSVALDTSMELLAGTVPAAVCVEEHGGVSVAQVTLVTQDLARQIVALLLRRGVEVPEQLVLDLRGCRGGDLGGALAVASHFIRAGTPLLTRVDEDGDCEVLRSQGGPWLATELEVWVDGGTASAAEVLAAALWSCGRARLYGEPTYGKGSVAAWRGGRFVATGEVKWLHGQGWSGAGLLPDGPFADRRLAVCAGATHE